MVGAAKEVVGQQAVVGGAVLVEEADVGFDVLNGEGLVVAVALVDAVQLGAHTGTLSIGGASHQHHQQSEDIAYKLLHVCKVT